MQIESIGQTLVSSPAQEIRASEQRCNRSISSVLEDARLLMLWTPPFTEAHTIRLLRVICRVRENGAQTIIPLWAALETARLGHGNRAMELYQMINPVTHALTPEGVATYKVEPYVVAADVYTAEGHLGRGGWTWYTGSASWLYRVGLEGILGFTKRGRRLRIDPCVPSSWDGFTIEYRHERAIYRISVENPSKVERGVASVVVDGNATDGWISLSDV